MCLDENEESGPTPGVCESCGVVNDDSRRPVVVYVEEYHSYMCGTCEAKQDDGVEQHEERKRQRLAEENERRPDGHVEY